MATKTKKDTVTDLLGNIYNNNAKEITPTKVKVPFSDIINSVAFNLTIAQLQQEDDSAEHSLAHILDTNKMGLFYYDSNDITTAHDGVVCIVTASGKRYKRLISRRFDAKWTGIVTSYFTTLAAANTAIPMTARFVGLEVDILLAGGTLTTYWYRDGVGNANLISKNSEVQLLDFTIGDGATYTPADNADTLTNPILVGRTIILYSYGNTLLRVVNFPATLSTDETYSQYNSVTGDMKLINGVYSQDTRGLVIYK